jgi:hypothetical protein
MSIQTQSRPNNINFKGAAIAVAAVAGIAIAAVVPFVRQDSSPSNAGFAPSYMTAPLSDHQRFAAEMEQHEALTEAVFGPLAVSDASVVAFAAAEHGAYFPVEASSPVSAAGAEVSRALAEHWALIEPYVS